MTTSIDTSVGTQVYRVYIKATAQAIWDAITRPEWSERYGYRVRGDFDLRPGGAYRAYANEGMRAMGAPDLIIDGEVVEADPPRRLVITWRMLMDPEIAAEGFTRLTYEIAEGEGGISKLTVIHEVEGKPNLATVLSGGMEDVGAGGGWNWVLSDLKTLLETGAALEYQGGRSPH
jgi:uncharacterized protein YndB with AHSA1/START domain